MATVETTNRTTRDDWQQIPPAEWSRRLAQAQALALSNLARHGLDYNSDDSIAGLILESETGAAVAPQLKHTQDAVRASLHDLYMNQGMKHYVGSSEEPIDDEIFNYAMAAAEAGFLFGVLTGAHVSPTMVAAIAAPSAPPVARTPRAGKKGGAR